MLSIEEIEQLIELMKETGIMELSVEKEGFKVFLRRSESEQAESQVRMEPSTMEKEIVVSSVETADTMTKTFTTPIISPLVGIFHNGGISSRRTIIREGDIVREGQLLAIIEAMKVPNEIHSPISGKISRLLAEDGHGVEYGQTLFLIEPEEESTGEADAKANIQ